MISEHKLHVSLLQTVRRCVALAVAASLIQAKRKDVLMVLKEKLQSLCFVSLCCACVCWRCMLDASAPGNAICVLDVWLSRAFVCL